MVGVKERVKKCLGKKIGILWKASISENITGGKHFFLFFFFPPRLIEQLHASLSNVRTRLPVQRDPRIDRLTKFARIARVNPGKID